MTTLRPSLQDIYAPIEADLAQFSEVLRQELRSEDALISQIHEHLLKMSGKFLRPALTLLSARAAGQGSEKAARLAAAIELIHTATLVHDDIIDDSELRRNQPSVYYKWGREISIVSGDYLYAKAFMLLASLDDIWVNKAFSACAHLICEGEMKQIEKRTDFRIDESEYLKIIHRKTAALFQAACMGGAYFGGASPDIINRLGDYGYSLGMAFQIVDDCLDLVGQTESLGKTAGLDVYKNDVTLPLLYLYRGLTDGERAEVFGLNGSTHSPRSFEGIREMAQRTGAVDQAMARAKAFAAKCVEDLGCLPASPYRDSLVQLASHCVDRIR